MGEWAVSTGPVMGQLVTITQCPADRQRRLQWGITRTFAGAGEVQMTGPGSNSAYVFSGEHPVNMLTSWLWDMPTFEIASYKTADWPDNAPDETAPLGAGYQTQIESISQNGDLSARDGRVRANGDVYRVLGYYFDPVPGSPPAGPEWLYIGGTNVSSIPYGSTRGDAVQLLQYDWQLDRMFFSPRNDSAPGEIYDCTGGTFSLFWSATGWKLGGHGSGGYALHLEAPDDTFWVWSVIDGSNRTGVAHLNSSGTLLGSWFASTSNTQVDPIHVGSDGSLFLQDRGATAGQRWKRIDPNDSYQATLLSCQNPLGISGFNVVLDVVPTNSVWSGSHVVTNSALKTDDVGDASGTYGGIAQWYEARNSFFTVLDSAIR